MTTTMTDNKPSMEDVLCNLVAARVLIDANGLRKAGGNSLCLDGTHCSYMAAVAVHRDVAPPRAEVARALGFKDLSDLCTWNDDPKTTKADVLARFDAAIARIEKELDQ